MSNRNFQLSFIYAMRDFLNAHYDATNEDISLEAAGYSKNSQHPVFVVLTYGHSPMSFAIKTVSGDTWSHSAIAFDISLNPMYSFGPKMKGVGSGMGFAIVEPKSAAVVDKPIEYAIYVSFMDAVSIEKMKRRMEFFHRNEDKLKYDFIGCLKCFFNIIDKDERAWFCSRFVAEILKAGKSSVITKDPSLYRPQQLDSLEDFELLEEGKDIRKWDPVSAKRKLDALKKMPSNKSQNEINAMKDRRTQAKASALELI
ncbi:MAG: hypothetical protein NC548_05735 [Lachnospiraceae bacterium]|nr:hypothetical protein [Lachnospiraceae bacterium]